MQKLLILTSLALTLLFQGISTAAPLTGKELSDDTFVPYQQDDSDMRVIKPKMSFTTKGIQYGGWITPVYLDDNDGVKNLATSINTARIWLKSYLWENAYVYVRGKDIYSKIIKSDGYAKTDFEDQGYDNNQKNFFDLDTGFLTMATGTGNLKLSLGRIFFLMGSGLILNGRGDGGELGVYTRYVNLEVLGSYTGLLKKDDDPYRLSTRDNSDGSNRVFAGGTLSFFFSNQSFYLMGLAQIDRGKNSDTEKSKYQSQYYGAGLKGVVLTGLAYNAEFIYEMGKSYTAQGNQTDIKAYAGILNMNYYFDMKIKPSLILQYAYGSGDKDKSNYISPNSNGKGDDSGFLYFGTYVGGYALRPVLANIHIARAGFSVAPWATSRTVTLKRLSFIGKYSYYMKDQVDQPIKNEEAKASERFIGQGLDGSLRWGFFDDLAIFVNYAVFLPGKAYASPENTDMRKFLMCGMNLNF